MRPNKFHTILVVTLLAGCAQDVQKPAQPALRADLTAPWVQNGQINWPPNDGCDGTEKSETLPQGTLVDRYGSDYGTFFAQPGTPYEARALPYDTSTLPYHIYIVAQPLTVLECRIAPWFGEPGGGEQYKAPENALQLKAEGVLQLKQ